MIWTIYSLEILKLRKRLVSVAIYLLYILLLFFTYGAMAYNSRAKSFMGYFTLPTAWPPIFQAAFMFTGVFAGALLVLQTATEFEWRTARQGVIDGMTRQQWLTGKFLLALTLACVFFATQFVFATGLALFATKFTTAVDLFGATEISALAGTLLATLMVCCIALLFAVLLRSSGLALGAALLSPLLTSIIDKVLRGMEWTAVAELMPFEVISELNNYKLHIAVITETSRTAHWPMAVYFAVAACWLLLIGAGTAWAFNKRDL